MDIKMENTKNGIMQIREKDGKKYICLYDVMKVLGVIKSYGLVESEAVNICGEIIYGPMIVGNNIIYTAFLEERAVNELLNKRQPNNQLNREVKRTP